MNTKVLLAGLIGFFIGGLLVSVVATTMNTSENSNTSSVSATQMLEGKKGSEFDKAYIEHMIVHHQDAVDMSKLAEENAERQEIKDLANDIISAQTTEITQMEQWLIDWGYKESETSNPHSMH